MRIYYENFCLKDILYLLYSFPGGLLPHCRGEQVLARWGGGWRAVRAEAGWQGHRYCCSLIRPFVMYKPCTKQGK